MKIEEQMALNLLPKSIDERNDNIINAIDSLSKAADILDNIGDYKAAEIITSVMEKVSKRQ